MLGRADGLGAGMGEERSGSCIGLPHLVDLAIPFIIVDPSGRIVRTNPSAEAILGRGSAEMVGETIFSLLTEESGRPDRALALALRRCLTGELVRATALFTSLAGPLPLRCTLLPVTGTEGEVEGAAVLLSRAPLDAPGTSVESSLQLLARTSADIMENDDLADLIEEEVARLVASLGLDLAVLRMQSPEGRPLMMCHGVGYKEGRELLETATDQGIPLYVAVSQGRSVIVDDPADPTLDLAATGLTSLACISLHCNGTCGCALFGTRSPGKSARSNHPVLEVFCNLMSISLRNAVLNRELNARNTQLRGLYETSKAVSSSLDRDEVLQTILSTAMGLVGAENCFIFGLDQPRKKLHILCMMSDWGVDPTLEIDIGEGLVGLVARTGKGILAERADLDPRSLPVEGTPDTPSSMIVVPLVLSDKLLGVMSLEKTPGVPFNQAQYELIETFSIQAAVAINNASLYEALKATASSLRMYNVLLTHDVANFNVPIHGFLEMLLKDPKLDERQRRYVRSALVQSDNISELITDVRELYMLRSTQGEVVLAPVNMIPVINEARENIFSNAVYEDVETTFISSVEHAEVMADAFLKDLFYNLMSNACKYGRGRPVEITVSETSREGREWWKVSILDCGNGIMDERKAQLFKRFEQLDTTQAADGHGLGLSVVGELVARYGGRVWVEDRMPGDHTKGSLFIVLLPKIDGCPHPEG